MAKEKNKDEQIIMLEGMKEKAKEYNKINTKN